MGLHYARCGVKMHKHFLTFPDVASGVFECDRDILKQLTHLDHVRIHDEPHKVLRQLSLKELEIWTELLDKMRIAVEEQADWVKAVARRINRSRAERIGIRKPRIRSF